MRAHIHERNPADWSHCVVCGDLLPSDFPAPVSETVPPMNIPPCDCTESDETGRYYCMRKAGCRKDQRASAAQELPAAVGAETLPSESGASHRRDAKDAASAQQPAQSEAHPPARATPRTDAVAPHLNLSHSDMSRAAWALRKLAHTLERDLAALTERLSAPVPEVEGQIVAWAVEGASRIDGSLRRLGSCYLHEDQAKAAIHSQAYVGSKAAVIPLVPVDLARDLARRLADEKMLSEHRTQERNTRFDEAIRWEKGFHEQRQRAEAAESALAAAVREATENSEWAVRLFSNVLSCGLDEGATRSKERRVGQLATDIANFMAAAIRARGEGVTK